jgi:hypothetical protein
MTRLDRSTVAKPTTRRSVGRAFAAGVSLFCVAAAVGQSAEAAAPHRLAVAQHRVGALAHTPAGCCSTGRTSATTPAKAVGYIDRILRGARAADLPVEMPTRLSLTANLKTAMR